MYWMYVVDSGMLDAACVLQADPFDRCSLFWNECFVENPYVREAFLRSAVSNERLQAILSSSMSLKTEIDAADMLSLTERKLDSMQRTTFNLR
jgi:hypothetical protein